MSTLSQVKALLESHIEGDDSRFFATAMQFAAAEARKGESKAAAEIKALVDRARSGGSLLPAQKNATPLARPIKGLDNLLSIAYPSVRLHNMTLENSLRSRIERVLEEHKNIEKIRLNGLSPRRKLLLTGPPGCGKTMAASVLAGELSLPLFVVKLDGLITKFMGESMAKLRNIFDSIRDTRAVYLFDEFDSIGSQRGLSNDVGEMKRILNSFLMYIEEDNSNSIIVAATNHRQHLDFALFRRFDELIEFELPETSLIEEFIRSEVARFTEISIDYDRLSKIAIGLSFADIGLAINEAMKTSLLRERAIETADIELPLRERAEFHHRYNS